MVVGLCFGCTIFLLSERGKTDNLHLIYSLLKVSAPDHRTILTAVGLPHSFDHGLDTNAYYTIVGSHLYIIHNHAFLYTK
jgi:hypothetical protein